MKKLLFVFLGTLFSATLFAQKASELTINETCSCVNKIKKNLSEEEKTNQALLCMTSSLMKNMDKLKKEYKIKTDDMREAGRQVGAKMGAQLITDCPAMGTYLVKLAAQQSKSEKAAESADINPDTLKLDNTVCKLFKTGKYKSEKVYFNSKLVADDDATSYTEIKDGLSIDYRENKKYITKWSVKYPTDCEWELTLVESNDPNIKAVFKKGDKLIYSAAGSEGKMLYISFEMMGMQGLALLKKI